MACTTTQTYGLSVGYESSSASTYRSGSVQEYMDDFNRRMDQYWANLGKRQLPQENSRSQIYVPPALRRRNHSLHQRQFSPPRDHSPLSRKNVSSGCIVFAPKHEDSPKNLCVHPGCVSVNCNYLSGAALNHPAVVLDLVEVCRASDNEEEKDDGRICTVALCAMISSNPHPDRSKARCSVPIFREDQAPGVYSSFEKDDIMYLEEDGTMTKQSYIQLDHVIMIPLSQLEQFNGQPFQNRLTRESIQALETRLEIGFDEWEETADLRAGFIED